MPENQRDFPSGMRGCRVNVCFNYGGRDEIVRAARHFAADCAAGGRKPEELTEVLFSEYLCSNGVPDPDLVIRPSGEVRISNFLLWQSAYAEFYFTDVLWPDFSKEELHRALAAYQGRSAVLEVSEWVSESWWRLFSSRSCWCCFT